MIYKIALSNGDDIYLEEEEAKKVLILMGKDNKLIQTSRGLFNVSYCVSVAPDKEKTRDVETLMRQAWALSEEDAILKVIGQPVNNQKLLQ